MLFAKKNSILPKIKTTKQFGFKKMYRQRQKVMKMSNLSVIFVPCLLVKSFALKDL